MARRVARNAAMMAFGIVVGVVAGAALGLRAEDPKSDLESAAVAAGVDVQDLAGAVNTVGVDPYTYLRSTGELPPLPVPREPTIPPPLYNARVECIESKESGGANVANHRGSGAVGVLQYMPSTFAAHAREMGHPEWSPWTPWQARAVAAWDLAHGRRAQWAVGGC